jgi:hypothetical protein
MVSSERMNLLGIWLHGRCCKICREAETYSQTKDDSCRDWRQLGDWLQGNQRTDVVRWHSIKVRIRSRVGQHSNWDELLTIVDEQLNLQGNVTLSMNGRFDDEFAGEWA